MIPNHHHYFTSRGFQLLGLLMDQSEEKQCATTLRIYKKIHVGKIFISSSTTQKRYLRWLSVISLLKSDIKKNKKNFMEELKTLVLYANYLLLVNNFFFSFHFIYIFIYSVVLLNFFYFSYQFFYRYNLSTCIDWTAPMCPNGSIKTESYCIVFFLCIWAV